MKICIIGSGLTSLILAKNLIKKNLYVDIIYENYQKEPTSASTICITNQNFQFLENLYPTSHRSCLPCNLTINLDKI